MIVRIDTVDLGFSPKGRKIMLRMRWPNHVWLWWPYHGWQQPSGEF